MNEWLRTNAFKSSVRDDERFAGEPGTDRIHSDACAGHALLRPMVIQVDPYLIGDIVAAIYRSAYDAAEWPETIERMRAMFHGSKACLARAGPNLGPGDVVAPNSDPAFQLAFVDFVDEAMTYAGVLANVPDGLVFRDDVLFGHLRRGRFWNEWLSPQDMYGGLSVNLMKRDQSVWFFDIQRGRRQERFSTADAELFAYLAPHVTRAVEIARGIGSARAAGILSESSTLGIIVIDGEFRIKSINSLAEAMLARPGSPLRRRPEGLKASARSANALQRLVVDACAPRDGIAPGGGGELVLRADPQAENPVDLAVSVAPATSGPGPAGFLDRVCFLMIRELSFALPPGFEALSRDVFGLTAKEAQVAVGLAAGQTLKDIALSSRTSLNTVRTHLDKVFRKTSTRQQSELVALLKTIEPLARKQ